MNIDEFREEQARIQTELEVEGNAQTEQGATAVVEEVVQETPQEGGVPTEETTEGPTQVVEQSNQEVTALQAQLQQATRALQEAEEAKQWYNKINANPEYAKAFAEDNGLTYVDPNQRAVQEVQQRYNELLLEKEINLLQVKYADFDAQTVIKTAVDKGINNLEDAYILAKATTPKAETLDPVSLKEQIRQEILNELQSNVSTTSMIGSGGTGSKGVQPVSIELSSSEIKVAQGMGLSPAEYQKWKQTK